MINPKSICNTCKYRAFCRDSERNLEITYCNEYNKAP